MNVKTRRLLLEKKKKLEFVNDFCVVLPHSQSTLKKKRAFFGTEPTSGYTHKIVFTESSFPKTQAQGALTDQIWKTEH